MYVINSLLLIAGNIYPVIDARRNSTWKSVSETATFTIPRVVRYRGNETETTNLIQQGQVVAFTCGLDTTTCWEFSGYVSTVRQGETLAVTCMNEAYFLDKIRTSFYLSNATISGIFAAIKKDAGTLWPYKSEINHVEAGLGKLRVMNATARQVIGRIYNEYGVGCWSREGVLHVGLDIVPTLVKTVAIDFAKHVMDDSGIVIETGAPSVKIKVVGIKNGIKYEFTAGDANAETRVMTKLGLDLAGCKQLALALASRKQQDGYSGKIKLFGWPPINHGDTMRFVDPRTNAKKGKAVISEVEYGLNSTDGIYQLCTIHRSY